MRTAYLLVKLTVLALALCCLALALRRELRPSY
jgi:hypothetical protein